MKLNYKRTFFIGLAFLSICSFWQMYDNIVPLILQNSFHLGDTSIGFVMSIDNILAVFFLPLIGAFSDKVDTRWGKRTPFIFIGTICAIIFMLLMPYAGKINSFPLFVVALGVTLLSMSLYRSPSVALMPDLTPKPLRSSANAVINLMGAIGGVYTLIMIKLLVPKEANPDYENVFISVAIIMIISVIILMIKIKEKKEYQIVNMEYPDEMKKEISEEVKIESEGIPKGVKKSLIFILISIAFWFMAYNAVTTAFSRYASNVWKLQGGGFANCLMVATVVAIVSYMPIAKISERLGRKKTILIGLILMFISYTAALFYTSYNFSINIFFGIIGFAWAAINVNSFPMVVEMSKGSDIGKYTGLYYTFSMAAQIFTPILSGALLQYISYKTLFPYAMFFTIIAFCTMLQVKHGDVEK